MDQISISYNQFEESYRCYVAEKIVEEQGNCTDLDLCLMCPFFKECCKSIEHKSKFLSKETRLKKAEDYLFTKILEKTLE